MVVSASTAAVANHLFPDVPTNSAFHTEVANVVGAGCGTGFTDGTFRPLDAPTRQQFAAWTNRCGGRIAHGGRLSVNTSVPTTYVDVRTIDITAGAAVADTSEGGFLLVLASGMAHTTAAAASCPCYVDFAIETANHNTHAGQAGQLDDQVGPVGLRATTPLSAQIVIPIAAGATEHLTLKARYIPTSGTPSVSFTGSIDAVYVPFGPDGDNTLTFEN
jgi:hypothetical protein